MKIGIVNEQKNADRRVALIPSAAHDLKALGAEVIVESNAGTASSFINEKYEQAGGRIVYSKEEVFGMSDVIMKIARLSSAECEMLTEGQTVFSFHHLAVAPDSVIRESIDKGVTLIGYELMANENGELPVLKQIGHIAGQLCILIAARCLQSNMGGRGIILGGVPGIPPANVVILGAGNVGFTAAETAVRLGAQVIVLDQDMQRLELIHQRLGSQVSTMLSNDYNIARALAFADVAIGAVSDHGERTPKLVSEAVVASMKPGSVIVDLSIDQGGCFETSRPTTFESATYVHKGVVHYCVPNTTSGVARVSSIALNNVIAPYLADIVTFGCEEAMRHSHALKQGAYIYQGKTTNAGLSEMCHLPLHSIENLLG